MLLFGMFILTFVACKKGDDSVPPPVQDSTVVIVKDSPAYPKARMYAGSYHNFELFDNIIDLLRVDTSFLDTMHVTFLDSVNIQVKLYTYTLFHDKSNINKAGPAGRDSIEFTSLLNAADGGAFHVYAIGQANDLRFFSNRDSVYLMHRFHSGEVGYYHNTLFSGKKQ